MTHEAESMSPEWLRNLHTGRIAEELVVDGHLKRRTVRYDGEQLAAFRRLTEAADDLRVDR
jgi:hypothetical protein